MTTSVLVLSIIDLAGKIENARTSHYKNYPDGDWKGDNKRLGVFALLADRVIRDFGLWPPGRKYLSNECRVRLLRSNAV